jgi:hypothetical protein
VLIAQDRLDDPRRRHSGAQLAGAGTFDNGDVGVAHAQSYEVVDARRKFTLRVAAAC